MAGKFFALLTGIDTYAGDVSHLSGCVNDVNAIGDFLKTHITREPYIETLLNGEATRENIISLFRRHLCRADKDDVVFFHYSGHGSRARSAAVFHEYFSEEMDETLVCYDSRTPDGLDLADKELAALLWEVNRTHPHIVVSLDCCHSGSGTRDAQDTELTTARQTPARAAGQPRPLETYLDGFYQRMEQVHIPRSQHLLMAACDRTEKAWETNEQRGAFSVSLLEVLEQSGLNISYADLFVRARSAIYKWTRCQSPQFEPYADFMPYSKFLDGGELEGRPRYYVYFKRGDWIMDAGALHGLPTEAEKKVKVALYPEAQGALPGREAAGAAHALSVGAQKTLLALDFEAGRSDRYYAEILSMPVPPMPVLLEAEGDSKTLLEELTPKTGNFAFYHESRAAKVVLSVKADRVLIRDRESGRLIHGAEGDMKKCFLYIFNILERLVRWERGLALQNHRTAFDTGKVDFTFLQTGEGGKEYEHPGDRVNLDFTRVNGEWRPIGGKLRVRNRTGQAVHVLLVYFSRRFGIYPIFKDPLPPGKGYVTMWGEGPGDYFKLPEGTDESADRFKLIVSTEPVDHFLLMQKDIKLGEIIPVSHRDIGTFDENPKVTEDWFCKSLTITTTRR
jgi:hypothetical protein